MIAGGYLQKQIGIKRTVLFGCSVMIFATFLSYLTVDTYPDYFLIYGIPLAVGNGLTFMGPMTISRILCKGSPNSNEVVSKTVMINQQIDCCWLLVREDHLLLFQ